MGGAGGWRGGHDVLAWLLAPGCLSRRRHMFQNFRLSMTWLHTWFGLVLGYVLMVAFFFGALSVFDREIDRWAMPETRFEPQRDAVVRRHAGADLRADRARGGGARGGARARRRTAARPRCR